ncbi:MAG: tRNA glutamyl-Q(34) synthetase GluQRS [Ghiorsea sp.]|nr:tRNA glutamyl-Q(34) synthetase GluQRS [Ghiorsea sp.]
MKKTRFAPSPTGLLHLGNAYSALVCEQWAKKHDAALFLRVEDIDFTRCKPKFSKQMLDDLTWLGISFDVVSFQQQRLVLYEQALQQLIDMDVLYPCFCTRKQVNATLASQKVNRHLKTEHCLEAYPGTCKHLATELRQQQMLNMPYAWRLDCQTVFERVGKLCAWQDVQGHKHLFNVLDIGDVIIGRKDIRFSYHLCVVVDDAEQGITHVIRGEDLRSSTPVHHVLQRLLGYKSPQYLHHVLITNNEGVRLAKSKGSPALQALRENGVTAEQVRQSLGF